MKLPVRYGLRALFLVVTLSSVGLGGYLRLARQRTADAEAFERFNASLPYGYRVELCDDVYISCIDGVDAIVVRLPQAPKWLVTLGRAGGSDLFHRVEAVFVLKAPANGHCLEELQALPHLSSLKLPRTPELQNHARQLQTKSPDLTIEWFEP